MRCAIDCKVEVDVNVGNSMVQLKCNSAVALQPHSGVQGGSVHERSHSKAGKDLELRLIGPEKMPFLRGKRNGFGVTLKFVPWANSFQERVGIKEELRQEKKIKNKKERT